MLSLHALRGFGPRGPVSDAAGFRRRPIRAVPTFQPSGTGLTDTQSGPFGGSRAAAGSACLAAWRTRPRWRIGYRGGGGGGPVAVAGGVLAAAVAAAVANDTARPRLDTFRLSFQAAGHRPIPAVTASPVEVAFRLLRSHPPGGGVARRAGTRDLGADADRRRRGRRPQPAPAMRAGAPDLTFRT